jgi:PAS domain S-box-containing protein
MKISYAYKLFLVSIALVLVTIGLLILRAFKVQDAVVDAEDHRFRSFLLAMELFQSSEDLTRLARSYASSGDPAFEERYLLTLDLRNGRPVRGGTNALDYWRLSRLGQGSASTNAEAASLEDMLRREGFAQGELDLFREAQRLSEESVKMEREAFAARKGLFDDGRGNFTVRRDPDSDYAVDLLSSDKYLEVKGRIADGIHRFLEAMDTRARTELSSKRAELWGCISWAVALAFIAFLIVIIVTIHAFRAILIPIDRLRSRVAEIRAGNYSARCEIVSNTEIGELCSHFNSMAGALEADIAKRKEVEAALRESRQKFQGLVETLSDLVWEVDAHGRYTYVSPQIKNILGYEPHEVIGKTPYDLMSAAEAVRVSAVTGAFVMERKPIAAMENTNLHKDGHEVVLETSGLPFFDSEGNFCGYRGTDRDVTRRKVVESELRRSEEKFSKAFQTSPHAIIITRLRDGGILEVNDALVSLLGYTRAELTGQTTQGLRIWVDEKNREEVVAALREGRPVIGREFQFRRKDGGLLIGSFSTHPLHLSQEVCILSSVEDITERKRTEQELRSNRRFLSDLIEHSGALICVKDRERRYTLVNHKWEMITGIKREYVLGRADEDLFPDFLSRQFRLNDEEVMRSGCAREIEETLEDERGKRFFLSIKFPVRGGDGAVDGLCGMITEITARKEAEAERERTIDSLQTALTEIRTLRGIVPICASCKMIRNDKGYWERVEAYISKHTEAEFSHGICPDCAKKLYPDLYGDKTGL